MTGRPPLNVEYKEMVSITKNFTRKKHPNQLGVSCSKTCFRATFRFEDFHCWFGPIAYNVIDLWTIIFKAKS